MKPLHNVVVKRIQELAKESKDVVLKNHKDMGEYCSRDSAFNLLGRKLDEIEEIASALRNDA